VLSLSIVVLSACSGGIPQEEFDTIATELTESKNQLTTLRVENEKLTQEVTDLQNELMSTQDEGKVLSADLTTSRMRVSELEN